MYLLEYETLNIFNITINKVILFKNFEDAYNYGLKIEPLITRSKINSIEQTKECKIIWESAKSFPKYRCKIYNLDSDVVYGIYATDIISPNFLVQNIYKTLKINEVLYQ
jgi:hypothetical protein